MGSRPSKVITTIKNSKKNTNTKTNIKTKTKTKTANLLIRELVTPMYGR